MTGPPVPVFPLSAVVGADDARLALLLVTIDPGIGGVLLRGDKGSGKTTTARALAGLMPGHAPFVELPLGATEDRVVGSFDVRAALGSGDYRYRPGLLETAHGGVLYVDEVNLLADHLVDLLLDAAATGAVVVERDGVSERRTSRFVLVGSMNPEEGELRPQLLDRFGLSATVGAPTDARDRAEAVRRRLAFDRDPAGESARWSEAEDVLRRRLAAAQPAALPDALHEHVAGLCAAAGAEGLRADLVVCRAAAALAGWDGREEATEGDVRRVAPLALAHRRSTPWDPLPPPPPAAPAPPPPPAAPAAGSSEGAGDPGSSARPAGEGPASRGRDPGPDPGSEPGTPRNVDPGRPPPLDPSTVSPRPPPPPLPPPAGAFGGLPSELLDQLRRGAGRRDGDGTGRGGRRAPDAGEALRGRLVGSRVPPAGRPPGAVHPVATVLAAVERQAGAVRPPVATGGAERLRVLPADVREPVRRQPTPTLVVMVVDASGSMGVRGRVAAARAAVLSLLVDAYQRRDRVAVVTFRGDGAQTVLRPTASTEVARARLDGIATGGRTPLAAGLAEGLAVATGRRHAGDRPLLVLVSDGRATAASAGADPLAAALEAAAAVRAAGVGALVVDCEAEHGPRLGLAARLAAAMGGRHVEAGELTGEALASAVRGSLGGPSPVPDASAGSGP